MSTELPTEAESFHQYLNAQLSNGGKDQSPEELLHNWRCQQEYENTVSAIQEGLADVKAGRTQPFDEFDQEFRKQRKILRDE